jgi:hypothetical protein
MLIENLNELCFNADMLSLRMEWASKAGSLLYLGIQPDHPDLSCKRSRLAPSSQTGSELGD